MTLYIGEEDPVHRNQAEMLVALGDHRCETYKRFWVHSLPWGTAFQRVLVCKRSHNMGSGAKHRSAETRSLFRRCVTIPRL